MRHKGVGKAEMAERMMDAAGRGFRRSGFAGIGVDGLAKQAGVTSGAFYSHFSSKGNAFQKVLEAGLDEVLERLPIIQAEQGEGWVVAFADYYLGKTHRNDVECGCAMAALTGDVVRAEKTAHVLYEKKMNAVVDVIAGALRDGSEEERRARAWSMLGVLIGGVNVARAVQSTAVSNEIADAIRRAAVTAAGPALAI